MTNKANSLIVSPALTADTRRALWLSEYQTLVVADLHIGYAWSHRSKGQMLPVSKQEDTVDRLIALQSDYRPKHIVLLGDIVHDTTALPEVKQELERLIHSLSTTSQLTLILGNHDKRLERTLRDLPANVQFQKRLRLGSFTLLHGDDASFLEPEDGSQTLVIGHEHPTVTLDDGVASALRCPCFLFSEKVIVLPAFSPWANGCTVGKQPFLSPLLRDISFTEACTIVGPRLLRMPL